MLLVFCSTHPLFVCTLFSLVLLLLLLLLLLPLCVCLCVHLLFRLRRLLRRVARSRCTRHRVKLRASRSVAPATAQHERVVSSPLLCNPPPHHHHHSCSHMVLILRCVSCALVLSVLLFCTSCLVSSVFRVPLPGGWCCRGILHQGCW